jgi:hypothetical protein
MLITSALQLSSVNANRRWHIVSLMNFQPAQSRRLFMILRLRLPNKFLLCLLSLTGGAVAGTFWTFHGGADIASKGRAFGVIGATNGNHDDATSTTRRGSARGKSGPGGSYVSQMLSLAAGSYTVNIGPLDFSLEDRNLDFGANGVDGRQSRDQSQGADADARRDVFVNGVQTGSNLDSFNDVSVNLGNLAAGGHKIAFAEDPSIPRRAGQPHDDGEPIDNLYPSTPVPPSTSVPHSTSVPDFGGTFVLMLWSGAGLLIMGRLASRQLEK